MAPTYNTTELRRQNRNRVFRYVYSSETPVTKQDVAQSLNLSLPTVGQNLRELLDAGLLQLQGTFDSTGGRKPKAIGINAKVKCSIGLMLSSRHIHIVCIDLKARLICQSSIFRLFTGDQQYCRQLACYLEDFIDANQIDRSTLLGVGIAVPGILDEERNVVVMSHIVSLRELPVETLTAHIPYPCFIENDANAGGMAEWWDRPSMENMVYLSVQKGVGGAVLLSGVRYMGRHHHSGEFGHMCIVPGGRPCSCGKQGCLEAYCSTARISDDLGISREEFFSELEEGNAAYRAMWEDYLDHLALGIHNIRMVLDCDIVLGGILVQFMEPYLESLQNRLQELNPFQPDRPYLILSRYRSWSTCVGAALHFISSFLETI